MPKRKYHTVIKQQGSSAVAKRRDLPREQAYSVARQLASRFVNGFSYVDAAKFLPGILPDNTPRTVTIVNMLMHYGCVKALLLGTKYPRFEVTPEEFWW